MWLSVKSEPELEQLIQGTLIVAVESYDFKPRTTIIHDKNRKWLVSSAMQKAIRRGAVDTALDTVHGLFHLESEYVWRRLNTIVIEEVGVGDIALCAQFLWVSTRKVWRVNNGGDLKFLYMLVERMCLSVKDRMACDVPCWGILAPSLKPMLADMASWSSADLTATVLNPTFPISERLSAFLAAGHLPEGAPRGPKMARFEAIVGAMDHLPYVVRYVSVAGRKKQHELQPFGFPFVWELATGLDDPRVEVRPDALTVLPPLGKYPSEAFDRHNLNGKTALKYFMKACEPVRTVFGAYADTEAKVLSGLGAVLFRVEGQQVDRRMHYPLMMDLWLKAEQADLEHNGVPPEHQLDCMLVVQANLPLLHYSRCRTFDPAAFGGGPKPLSVTLEAYKETLG